MNFSIEKIEEELNNIKYLKKKMKFGILKDKGSSFDFKVLYP
jgi:hypothetical protein